MKVIAIPAILICTLVGVGLSHDDVAALRERGQAAVDELHAQGGDDALLDRVCAQKDCRASRLFWYTSLDEAKAAALRERKPILALYMLGRLDEELSCANSRFFRTILYSDPAISALMREKFVLYWHSVRPVPRITIDFGDGRTMKQTITGNSAHFLLDADGNPLDALPGLYAPNEFREYLAQWSTLRREDLGNYHVMRRINATSRWADTVQYIPPRYAGTAEAKNAAIRAVTKSAPEIPILKQLDVGESLRVVRPDEWASVALFEGPRVQLSPAAIELIRAKHFGDRQPAAHEMQALLDNLRGAIAVDTVFNECELHRQIQQWFLDGEVTTLARLSERVYSELFLTPTTDPWMGLRSPSVFTAIGE